MGLPKGHPPMPGSGRPKGSTKSALRAANKETAEEIRRNLTQAYMTNEPKIIEKLFRELMSLEGYAYVSALTSVLKNIMPALQSIEMNASISQSKSLLVEHIEQLKVTT